MSINNSKIYINENKIKPPYVNIIPNKQNVYITSARSDISDMSLFEEKIKTGLIKNINDCDDRKWTYLHYAVARDNVDAINMLVKYGANIEKTNEDGETPLFTAIILENINSIKALVKLGAKKDVRNELGFHLLFIAENLHNPIINKVLDIENSKKNIDIYTNQKVINKINADILKILSSKSK